MYIDKWLKRCWVVKLVSLSMYLAILYMGYSFLEKEKKRIIGSVR